MPSPPWFHYCENCDYNHAEHKHGPTYTWLCALVPHTQSGFCSDTTWEPDPPFKRCQDVNRFGNCGWHVPVREGEQE